MDRRNFLKFASASLFVPTINFLPKLPDQKLKIELRFDGDRFLPYYLRIAKGPYSTQSGYAVGQDLIDCHGLCANFEWAHLIKSSLEYGEEGMRQLFSLGWDCDEKDRQRLMKTLRRVEVTPADFAYLVLTLRNIRGPHNCVYSEKAWIETERLAKEGGYEILEGGSKSKGVFGTLFGSSR
jgi:hypothetical protein